MKNLFRTEELLIIIFSSSLFSLYNFSRRLRLHPGFLTDIGIPGYLIDKKSSAANYNYLSRKGIAIAESLKGVMASADMKSIFGHGLKYPDSFKNTHLGTL